MLASTENKLKNSPRNHISKSDTKNTETKLIVKLFFKEKQLLRCQKKITNFISFITWKHHIFITPDSKTDKQQQEIKVITKVIKTIHESVTYGDDKK